MRYVIIGNSAAGIGCAEGIRKTDKDGEIILFSKEKQHTYSRPLISYWLEGKTSLEKMKYRPDHFYKKNKIVFRPSTEVVSIDPVGKTVRIQKGESVSYDKLMIASGSKPFLPPMPGIEKVKKRFSFMSLDDAVQLEKQLTPESRVLIVGAGLIGLKCAEGIRSRVGKITVVDLADRVLPSILDEKASAMIRKHLKANGIDLILSDSVASFTAKTAALKSGKEIRFDLLVTAVGVRPNTEQAAQAGLAVKKGIVTDLHMRTSDPSIYAAGDCTESQDVSSGTQRILALLPNAYMQGECAGINMAGGNSVFDKAIPMNSMGLFGLHMVTAGTYEGDCYRKKTEDSYKCLYYKENVLKGFILIGDIGAAGIYTSMVRERTPLDSVDFDLLKKNPRLIAFSKDEREQKINTRFYREPVKG